MKKIFLILTLLAVLLPTICFAAEPAVTSDSKSFNPLTGTWSLEGNVTVRLGDRVITADRAQVHMFQMNVEAQGNIRLQDQEDGISFTSDEAAVTGKDSTVRCTGNCQFTQGSTVIKAQEGFFDWSSKLATFTGGVTVNGKAKTEPVVYDVINQKFK